MDTALPVCNVHVYEHTHCITKEKKIAHSTVLMALDDRSTAGSMYHTHYIWRAIWEGSEREKYRLLMKHVVEARDICRVRGG